MKEPLELLWAGVATCGFAFLFDLRLRDIPLAAAGAVIGWGLFATIAPQASQASGYFAAAAAIGLWAEILAAFMKRPATVFIVCAIIPLVPGGGMYYTMLESVRGDLWRSLRVGFETLQAAGAIAAGLAVSSAISRLLSLRLVARRIAAIGERPKAADWSCNERDAIAPPPTEPGIPISAQLSPRHDLKQAALPQTERPQTEPLAERRLADPLDSPAPEGSEPPRAEKTERGHE